MIFDDLVKHIADITPPFNDYALKGFVEDSINNSAEFPAMIFREGFKLIDDDIELMGYEVMSPEDCVKFELGSGVSKSSRPKIPLTTSHLKLIKYTTRFRDQYIETMLYTPYMFEGMLYIKDKRSMVRKIILERTFSRVHDKDKNGVSVSPVRAPLYFNRRSTFKINSYITGEQYSHFIVTARLFHGAIPNKICDTLILHYMLAKFGFPETLRKFGLSDQDISFTLAPGTDTADYEYFAARKYDDRSGEGPGLFLRVSKAILADDQSRKFVINLLYVLTPFQIQTFEDIYDKSGQIWKVILGIIIFGDRATLKAHSNAESHLRSVDYFIDPITKARFNKFGVPINDTYDLIFYIFNHIDSLMVNRTSQDLYHSRLDVSKGILVESYAKKIVGVFYYLNKKTNLSVQDVKSALRFNPMMFRMTMSNKSDDSEHYIAPPEIIGDSFLFSGGLNKIRMGGRPEQRLHPSMAVVESIDAFVGKVMGKTGLLNPFIPTDENGAITRPDYAEAIDKLSYYLPR